MKQRTATRRALQFEQRFAHLLWDCGVDLTGISGSQVFTGERNFTVKELEVFIVDQ
jgi:hypothetical protein